MDAVVSIPESDLEDSDGNRYNGYDEKAEGVKVDRQIISFPDILANVIQQVTVRNEVKKTPRLIYFGIIRKTRFKESPY